MAALSARQRARLRSAAINAELTKELRKALPVGAAVTPAATKGVLRAWRRLGRSTELSARARLALRERFGRAFERIFRDRGLTPDDFGLKDYKQLTEAFMTMSERLRYSTVALRKIRRMRGNFAGELLEQLVKHLKSLQSAFRRLAVAHIELLNSPKTKLLDSNGNSVTLPKRKFDSPLQATDITIRGRKFIDAAYVSRFENGLAKGKDLYSFCVEIEIGMPTSARKKGKQIGRTQARFDLRPGEYLEMTVGGERVQLSAEQIIFMPTSVNRQLVTVSATEHYRPSFTARGGYREHFWRIGVEMRTQAIREIVDVLVSK